MKSCFRSHGWSPVGKEKLPYPPHTCLIYPIGKKRIAFLSSCSEIKMIFPIGNTAFRDNVGTSSWGGIEDSDGGRRVVFVCLEHQLQDVHVQEAAELSPDLP